MCRPVFASPLISVTVHLQWKFNHELSVLNLGNLCADTVVHSLVPLPNITLFTAQILPELARMLRLNVDIQVRLNPEHLIEELDCEAARDNGIILAHEGSQGVQILKEVL